MAAHDSRDPLPMNSTLFTPPANVGNRLAKHPTLVNMHDAADMTITALPTSPTATETQVAEPKKSLWRRIVTQIKSVFRGKEKKEDPILYQGLPIGSPTDFRHAMTGSLKQMETLADMRRQERERQAREREGEREHA